ncbi:hypothetical protein [Nocardioides sp. R-C-SC26]|uniref:hypothetical protein n=1 Tax=Nocardioides sp. R-C-SC26 TaxID=2870414 RepID=UPI001E46AFA7|nr:hypothetical protein [Nocardioides sp. R-C-SC26]
MESAVGAEGLGSPRFHELAEQLAGLDGNPCEDANPIGYVTNPFGLTDALMPVIELVMISGAIAALVWGVRALRRDRDAVPLGIWLAAIVYVLVLEPPLYFPHVFGIEDQVGVVFVHNEFTVGLIKQRMPLYILLLYPAMVSLAWAIVARWQVDVGRSRLRAALVTGACVGAVHHVFYEIFDMLGPQRDWWIWDLTVATNGPRVASVPISSMVNFAVVMPAAFAFCAVMILQRRPRRTARSVLAPAIGVGVLTPIASAPGQLPATLLQAAPDLPDVISTVGMVALLGLCGVIAARELTRVVATRGPVRRDFGTVYGVAYLIAMAGLWIVALPQTIDGGPDVGSLPYVAVCFVLAAVVLAVTTRAPARAVVCGGPTRERVEA